MPSFLGFGAFLVMRLFVFALPRLSSGFFCFDGGGRLLWWRGEARFSVSGCVSVCLLYIIRPHLSPVRGAAFYLFVLSNWVICPRYLQRGSIETGRRWKP